MEFVDLQAFLHTATLGGLTRAGERLGVSKSIISRRLAKLEDELGARLLTRTTRGISLTEAGTEFLVYAQRILNDADEARAAIAGQDGELAGQLRLAAPLAFGIRHLAPALAIFAERHPRLAIDVSYGDHVHDIVRDGYDAAIRIGSLGNSSLLARRITAIRSVVAASPAYLARRGTPQTPQDLARHEALIYAGTRDPNIWSFAAKPKAVTVRVQGRMRADSGEALAAAAVEGLGIGVFPAFMIYRQLLDGTLVAILEQTPLPDIAMHLVRPAGPATAKLTLLAEFLIATFGKDQPWDIACRTANRSS
jgi:DNA-binding transcriptional LysR family regulator